MRAAKGQTRGTEWRSGCYDENLVKISATTRRQPRPRRQRAKYLWFRAVSGLVLATAGVLLSTSHLGGRASIDQVPPEGTMYPRELNSS